jgi:hypothetical protein
MKSADTISFFLKRGISFSVTDNNKCVIYWGIGFSFIQAKTLPPASWASDGGETGDALINSYYGNNSCDTLY